ncbi:MAG: hypothetical protein HOM58_11600 [Rhodospirillaceae bacterium]|nr:hypothetical protein [Rhodospirillaceae bacterium]MBT5455059.1 hypothetical protein [Rhodospirillaceae bacterium]
MEKSSPRIGTLSNPIAGEEIEAEELGMNVKRFTALVAMSCLLGGCTGHNVAYMAEKMDRKKFARDLSECEEVADKEVAQMRKEDEKAGRDSPMTSGEQTALIAFVAILGGPAAISHARIRPGIDQIALERCMLNRGYESRTLDSDDAEKRAAARENGTEMQFLEKLHKRYYK